jgi:hypothetical protein
MEYCIKTLHSCDLVWPLNVEHCRRIRADEELHVSCLDARGPNHTVICIDG